MTEDLLDHLKSLHTGAIDAKSGYDRALEDADRGKDLTGVFRDLSALHATNASELAALIAASGGKPDSSGSFMSTIHRTIMDIRSLLGGLDDSILPGLIDGEERNMRAYDEAQGLAQPDSDASRLLATHHTRLGDTVKKLRALKSTA